MISGIVTTCTFLAILSAFIAIISCIMFSLERKRTAIKLMFGFLVLTTFFGSVSTFLWNSIPNTNDEILQYVGSHSEQVVVRHPNGTIEILKGKENVATNN